MLNITEKFGPKQPGDISLWTVAIGELDPFALGEKKKAQDAVIAFVGQLPGFVGIHPVFCKGTLLLFRTKEQAKDCREALISKGCPVGKNVCECYAPEADLKAAEEAAKKQKN